MILSMDLDTATTRPGHAVIARSLSEGEVCADVMDVVDDDVEMGADLHIITDVEMTLERMLTAGMTWS